MQKEGLIGVGTQGKPTYPTSEQLAEMDKAFRLIYTEILREKGEEQVLACMTMFIRQSWVYIVIIDITTRMG